MKFGLVALISGVTIALVLSLACSDDKKTDTGSGSSRIPETKIGAKEYAFDAPDTITGGLVKLTLTNSGKEAHQAQLVRLNDGVTPAQFQTALMNPDPSAVLKIITTRGGPNAIEPGGSQTVINTLTPGNYALLCFVSGADDIPHLAKGMIKTFTVTAPTGTQAKAPETANKVTTADFSFLGIDTLPTGDQTIEVTNGGPQPHEVSILRLKSGLTADQLKAVIAGTAPTPPGPPPIEVAGGLGAMNVGAKGYLVTNLPAGSYAFVCFLPDANSGKPHAELGMVKGFTVK